VGEIAAPERRRRRARRVRDEDEYVVESVLDRRYFHRVEQFLIKWATTTMKKAGNMVMKKE
jgi:hypothetical protein